MKVNTNDDKSLLYLKIFAAFFLIVILIAVIYRVSMEFVNSSFTNNSFGVLYVGQDTSYIFLDKTEKKSVMLSVGDREKLVRGKSPFEISLAIGMPITCVVFDSRKSPSTLSDFSSVSNKMRLITDPGIKFKNCNRVDMHKVTSVIRSSHRDNRIEAKIDLFGEEKVKYDKEINDSVINNMNYSVEIENATGINGLGNQLAYILTTVGFNVIAVRTVNSDADSFVAYPGESNLYSDSLQDYTGFDFKQEKVSQTADMTVHLGGDIALILDQ